VISVFVDSFPSTAQAAITPVNVSYLLGYYLKEALKSSSGICLPAAAAGDPGIGGSMQCAVELSLLSGLLSQRTWLPLGWAGLYFFELQPAGKAVWIVLVLLINVNEGKPAGKEESGTE
jgi:hypothetical protein